MIVMSSYQNTTASGVCIDCCHGFWVGHRPDGTIEVDDCECGKNKVSNVAVSLVNNTLRIERRGQ